MIETYDAIVALSANVEASGRPDAEGRQRMQVAAQLLDEGMASHLVTSGNRPFRMANEGLPSAAMAMRNYAVNELGVPGNRVTTQELALDTIGDALFTKTEVTMPNVWHRLMIVTTRSHVSRATGTFRHVMGPSYTIRGFSSGEFPDRRGQRFSEFAGNVMTRAILGGTEPGDHDTIRERLFRVIPGYEEHTMGQRVGALLRLSPGILSTPKGFSPPGMI